MIVRIKGSVLAANPSQLVVDVNGIGYEVHISLHTYTQLAGATQVDLHTWLSIKEDEHQLFGFARAEEKSLFLLLIGVQGIGPNTARTILSYCTPSELRQAIRSGDEAAMRRIKGVGPKTAQRMLLELRDKIAREGVESGSNLDYPTTPNEGLEAGAISVSVGIQHNKTEEEALMALVALGFPKNQMEKVLSRLIQQAVQEGAPIVRADELVKRALRSV